MAIDTVIHTNQHSIDRVLKAGAPVLLVFWRARDQYSASLDPALNRLAERYAGKALIAKIDAEDEPALVKRFNISRTPTLVFTKNGNVEATAVGAVSEGDLARWMEYLVKGGTRPPVPSGSSAALPGAPASGRPYTNGGSAGHAQARPRPQAQQPRPAPGDGAPIKLSDANFDRYVTRGGVALVDFWAPWCGPCRLVAPTVEQLARELQGKAVIGKLNVDESPMIARRYGIMSIPTLYVFKDGQVVEQIVGAQPGQVIRQQLMKHL
jgi:thioredoxin 1